MSDFIRGQLVMLENLARVLNGERLAGSASEVTRPRLPFNPSEKPPDFDFEAKLDEAERLERESAEYRAALAQAADVVTATQQGASGAVIPTPAVKAFAALAAGQPIEYAVVTIFRRGALHWILVDDRALVLHGSPSWRGVMVVWLEHYFRHPHRERLRRCQQCARWFVDMTRNKSKLRCSHPCTIAWSNSQRPKGGTR